MEITEAKSVLLKRPGIFIVPAIITAVSTWLTLSNWEIMHDIIFAAGIIFLLIVLLIVWILIKNSSHYSSTGGFIQMIFIVAILAVFEIFFNVVFKTIIYLLGIVVIGFSLIILWPIWQLDAP